MFKRNCGRETKDKIKSIDMYGQQIMLTYKGDDTFKTTPGAVASIFVIAVLASFSFYRGYIFLNRINPSVSKQGFFRDLDQEPLFRPQD